jgi:hypothetical protein
MKLNVWLDLEISAESTTIATAQQYEETGQQYQEKLQQGCSLF